MKASRGILVAGIVTGGLLTMAPFFGQIVAIFGLAGAFHQLDNSGINDPRVLAHHIDMVLYTTMASLLLFPVGILLLAGSIILFAMSFKAKKPASPSTSTQ